MPHFWDQLGREAPKQRKLQDGLFQIASQTCNLLVQVNNTNNISYGHNSTNLHCNNLESSTSGSSGMSFSREEKEQMLVLIPPNADRTPKYKTRASGKPRLSVRSMKLLRLVPNTNMSNLKCVHLPVRLSQNV